MGPTPPARCVKLLSLIYMRSLENYISELLDTKANECEQKAALEPDCMSLRQ